MRISLPLIEGLSVDFSLSAAFWRAFLSVFMAIFPDLLKNQPTGGSRMVQINPSAVKENLVRQLQGGIS